MGHLLHHQHSLQDILQVELGIIIKDYPQDPQSLQRQGRYATPGFFPQITACYFQVL